MSEAIVATNEYGIVVRRRALGERNVAYEDLLKALQAQAPLDENSELLTFGPSHGGEAMDEFASRLKHLGLRFVDDFYCLSFDLPDWCDLRLALRHSRTRKE